MKCKLDKLSYENKCLLTGNIEIESQLKIKDADNNKYFGDLNTLKLQHKKLSMDYDNLNHE